jgi:hypothetical protein
MLDGYGNRIGSVGVFLTKYGNVEITDMTDDEVRDLREHSANPKGSWADFIDYLDRTAAWDREVNGRPTRAVSYADWKREYEERKASIKQGRWLSVA